MFRRYCVEKFCLVIKNGKFATQWRIDWTLSNRNFKMDGHSLNVWYLWSCSHLFFFSFSLSRARLCRNVVEALALKVPNIVFEKKIINIERIRVKLFVLITIASWNPVKYLKNSSYLPKRSISSTSKANETFQDYAIVSRSCQIYA